MKIALLQTPVIPLNLEAHGGLERVALYELDLLVRRSYEAKLFVSKLIGKKANVSRIRDLGWQNRVLKLFYYLEFWRINRNADVFHGHYTPILALLYPRKSIVHFHGLSISELLLHRYSYARKRYHRANYIFCARWVKEEFQKIYPDIPESQLHVVYNGADVENIRPLRDKTLGDTVNICFYSRWIREKGIYDVLSAAEILEQRGRKDFKIWYGGSALSAHKEKKSGNTFEIEQKVREWTGRLKSVQLVGNIKQSELSTFLPKMDFGLVPSTYADPFPLVPLEMMSAGLPVVAYAVGGLKESIIDGETGFLLENQNPEKLAEKIEYLLDNRKEIERMGRAARKHVEKSFSWERHLDQLSVVYSKVTGIYK
jgi:glycosyltransferase involved in cell wall biosynthesis